MNLTESNYHSQEANAAYMSNSLLGQWFKCEARQRAIEAGEYTDKKPDPKCFALGSMVDEALTLGKTIDDIVRSDEETYAYRGKPRAFVTQARAMVARAKRDAKFMDLLKGTPQAIVAFDWLGIQWKAKLDIISHALKRIVDLKTMGSGFDIERWDDDLGLRVPFYQQFDYWRQATIYRRAVYESTGDHYDVYIAAITNQDPPDLALYEFKGDHNFRSEEKRIANKVTRIKGIRSNKITPERCENCDYCRETKQLTNIIRAEYFRQTDITGEELLSGVTPS